MNVANKVLRRTTGVSSLIRPPVRHGRAIAGNWRTQITTAYSTTTTSASSQKQFNQLVEDLWHSSDLVSIRNSCSALASQVKNDNTPPLSTPSDSGHNRIHLVLRQLAESGRPEDLNCISQILRDVYPALGLVPSEKDYAFILRKLLNQDHTQQALDFLVAMETLPGGLKPTLKLVHTLLDWSWKSSSIEFLQEALQTLMDLGVVPSNKTFLILLQIRWMLAEDKSSPPTVDEVSTLIRWCVERGMTFDPLISSMLFENYARLHEVDLAKEVVLVYESVTRPTESLSQSDAPSGMDPAPVNALSTSDRARYMLRDATSYKDIEVVSKSLNITCDAGHHLKVISNCIRSKKYGQAFEIYERSKEVGIVPTAAMLAPLFEALYRGDYLRTLDQAVDRALDLYRHLADSWPPSKPEADEVNSPNGPSSALYRMLIRMALSSSDTQKYTESAQSLVSDVQARGLFIEPSFIAATRIILEMRRVGSFKGAKEVYHENRPQLDAKGYASVLKEYCRLSFTGNLEVPLITEYFSIVNQMRLTQVPVTNHVYTIILYQIGIIATKLRDNNMLDSAIHERLVETTRRVHDYLTLDAAIAPDATLWNQLMNTYQRLGLWNNTQKLWQMMFLSGRYDQITVNIMLDACGYMHQLRAGRALIARLQRVGFQLDLHNWDTWVEALCRNEHFDEALNVICVEMGRAGAKPHVGTIQIFRKFTKKQGWWKAYRTAVEKALPELWASLPREIRDP